MTPTVLFLGSIGAVAETSDLQRQAYNQAFQEHGLDWHWTPETYRALLQQSGGLSRLELLAAATNTDLSDETAQKIHARKTEIACGLVVDKNAGLRPGVAELVTAAKAAGAKVGWVTSTSEANTNAILAASGGALSAGDFDAVFHRDDAESGKPDPEIYRVALERFGASAGEAVAVEDSLQSVLAAKGAGIRTLATPGAFHDEPMAGVADAVYASAAEIPLAELFS